jgi:hypothetical protein
VVAVNVGATFPDDFEDSPLKSEILQKQNPNPGIEDSYHPVSIFPVIGHNWTLLKICLSDNGRYLRKCPRKIDSPKREGSQAGSRGGAGAWIG